MKRCSFKTIAVILSVGLILSSLPAAAQPIRPGPPPPDRMPRQGSAPTFRGPNAVAEGTVKQYLMNPHGEVDGLLLTDGTQIHFPPHMAAELVAAIRPGNPVSVEGDREGTSVVKAEAMTNIQSGRTVVEHAPSVMDRPIPPHLKRWSMNSMRADGTIEAVLYAPRGEVHGVLLADGTQIHVPPDVGESLSRLLKVGDVVQAEGYGTDNQYGRTLEATAIGLGGGRLIPLDRSIPGVGGSEASLPSRR